MDQLNETFQKSMRKLDNNNDRRLSKNRESGRSKLHSGTYLRSKNFKNNQSDTTTFKFLHQTEPAQFNTFGLRKKFEEINKDFSPENTMKYSYESRILTNTSIDRNNNNINNREKANYRGYSPKKETITNFSPKIPSSQTRDTLINTEQYKYNNSPNSKYSSSHYPSPKSSPMHSNHTSPQKDEHNLIYSTPKDSKKATAFGNEEISNVHKTSFTREDLDRFHPSQLDEEKETKRFTDGLLRKIREKKQQQAAANKQLENKPSSPSSPNKQNSPKYTRSVNNPHSPSSPMKSPSFSIKPEISLIPKFDAETISKPQYSPTKSIKIKISNNNTPKKEDEEHLESDRKYMSQYSQDDLENAYINLDDISDDEKHANQEIESLPDCFRSKIDQFKERIKSKHPSEKPNIPLHHDIKDNNYHETPQNLYKKESPSGLVGNKYKDIDDDQPMSNDDISFNDSLKDSTLKNNNDDYQDSASFEFMDNDNDINSPEVKTTKSKINNALGNNDNNEKIIENEIEKVNAKFEIDSETSSSQEHKINEKIKQNIIKSKENNNDTRDNLLPETKKSIHDDSFQYLNESKHLSDPGVQKKDDFYNKEIEEEIEEEIEDDSLKTSEFILDMFNEDLFIKPFIEFEIETSINLADSFLSNILREILSLK